MDNVKRTEQGGARAQSALCDRRIVTEISSDFSLPDYQAEIKRLLSVRATPTYADKYVGAGEAEFSGTVSYSILYMGNDGSLYSTTQMGEYRFSVPIEATVDFDLSDGLICDVLTQADSATGRVVAPRKLSVKCRLRSRVRIYGTRVFSEDVHGATPESIERLWGSAEYAESYVGIGEAVSLSDEILLDAGEETLRVISSQADVYVGEATCGSGCVNCRGEAVLKLLCTHEGSDALPFATVRRIPFSTSVITDGAEVNCAAYATGRLKDVSVSVEEGRILCEASVVAEARAERNNRVEFTEDAYSTEAEGYCNVYTVRLPYHIKSFTGNFSLNSTLSLEEAGIRHGATVADLNVTPCITSLENENGRYVLCGKCRCHALLISEEDAAMQEFELPFRFVTEGSADAVSDYDADIAVISCRARADGERILVDSELSVSLSTRGEREVRMLSEASFSDAVTKRDASYLIAFPAKEDSLWSVAKRYHRTVAEVSRMNPIAEGPMADASDSLAGVRYLLV